MRKQSLFFNKTILSSLVVLVSAVISYFLQSIAISLVSLIFTGIYCFLYVKPSYFGSKKSIMSTQDFLNKIEERAVKNQEGKVQEIVLDLIHFQKFTPELAQTLEVHKDSLLLLTLNNCLLSILENFPNLPNLIRLELVDNRINPSELEKLTQFKDLQSLSLGRNPIANFKDLEPLSSLPKLVQLDLSGCPICEKPDYREKVFGVFQQLEILDNKDQEGNDVIYDEEGEEDENLSTDERDLSQD